MSGIPKRQYLSDFLADLDRLQAHALQFARGRIPHPAARARGFDELADPVAAAVAFGSSMGFDRPHAEQVTKLSLSIYDQLEAIRSPLDESLVQPGSEWCTPRSRVLLHVAALLHDIGQVVSYERHHKHSAAMISTSQLPGLRAQELDIVAAIARYHRKALPRPRHVGYRELHEPDRALVRVLAAILRVGDALDHTHAGAVGKVSVAVAAGAVVLTAYAAKKPADELESCLGKGTLLEREFGLRLSVRWKPLPPLAIARGG